MGLTSCLTRFDVGDSGTETGSGSSGDTGCSEDCDGTECGPGLMACDGKCVDASNDPNNCGDCGTVCDTGQSCIGGNCAGDCQADCDLQLEMCVEQQCLCRPELVRCGGTCVDLDSNPLHCGQCDMDCIADVCDEGSCEAGGCEGEKTDCSGGCVDLEENPLHCGACDQKCEFDELCIGGSCRDVYSTCEAEQDCGGGQTCCSLEEGEEKICIEGEECP